jgi:hypothetical protein
LSELHGLSGRQHPDYTGVAHLVDDDEELDLDDPSILDAVARLYPDTTPENLSAAWDEYRRATRGRGGRGG